MGAWFFFFQAEDGIRDLVRSRGLGDVYKRQEQGIVEPGRARRKGQLKWYNSKLAPVAQLDRVPAVSYTHLTLPTSDLV